MGRIAVPVLALMVGLTLAAAIPSIPQTARRLAGLPEAQPSGTRQASMAPKAGSKAAIGEAKEDPAGQGKIAMTAEQVAASGIQVGLVNGGVLVSAVVVPGVLAANQDRLARVTARVGGTVAEVRKGLGERVTRGDVLAVIESRDIAEAKGEYLAAARTAALAETTLAREARLWKQRISAEQDFLRARAAAEEVRIRVDLARQRLLALGLPDTEVGGLPSQPVAALRRLEVRAPIAGQVTARAAVLGAAVGADAELFTVADPSTLWVEMAIPPRDVPMIRQGQSVTVSGDGDARGKGRIVFLSPVLDPETRSVRAVAELDNGDGRWRSGGFASISFAAAGRKAVVLVPRAAVQEIEGRKVIFIRTREGFERREVMMGGESEVAVEILSGLNPGVEIAVGNTFLLKAELGKGSAGD